MIKPFTGLLAAGFAMSAYATAFAAAPARAPVRHPVIAMAKASVTLDCVIRSDFGLQNCIVIKASPAGRGKADEVVKAFEANVHVDAASAAVGRHHRFTYTWMQEMA